MDEVLFQTKKEREKPLRNELPPGLNRHGSQRHDAYHSARKNLPTFCRRPSLANPAKSAENSFEAALEKKKMAFSFCSMLAVLLGVGLFVLFTQQLALHSKGHITGNKIAPEASGRLMFPGAKIKGQGLICDRSHYRTDVCKAYGNVQMNTNSSSLLIYVKDNSFAGIVEKIKPYTRKWETSVMDIVHELTLKTVKETGPFNLSCDITHEVPAVVFSTGGYTGNLYHEFNDGIIPLFITSQHLKKEVIYINLEFHNWWLTKYAEILKQLTNYNVITFENETRTHCFKEVTVGMFIHDELTVDSNLMLDNASIFDFRALLNAAYTPHWFTPKSDPDKPRLTILVREGSRMILNLDVLVAMAEEIGFNVTLWKPQRTTELKTTYELLNSSHVLLGVHGAALTHLLFMRPGSVFIQVIPLGTRWASYAYYGEPAEKLGLRYIGYKIGRDESSLSQKYDRDDIILTNPKAVVQKGWSMTKEIYLESQNVTINIPRMRKTISKAYRQATNFIRQQQQR